jgi:hypothetical protein
MSIERVIETIGLPAVELREFLEREITEFLEAETEAGQQREWSDVLFALKALCFAHTGRHLSLGQDGFVEKICSRLARYATISRHEPWLGEPTIASFEFGVVHLAFGQLKRKHTGNGKPLKNGTTAELVRLLDNPFRSKGHFAPHLVLTFADVDRIELSTLDRMKNKVSRSEAMSQAKSELAGDGVEDRLVALGESPASAVRPPRAGAADHRECRDGQDTGRLAPLT